MNDRDNVLLECPTKRIQQKQTKAHNCFNIYKDLSDFNTREAYLCLESLSTCTGRAWNIAEDEAKPTPSSGKTN